MSVFNRLGKRPMEVLRLSAKGMTSEGVAKEMGISPNTVKAHKALLYRALKVNNITHAVVLGIKAGVIPLEETDDGPD